MLVTSSHPNNGRYLRRLVTRHHLQRTMGRYRFVGQRMGRFGAHIPQTGPAESLSCLFADGTVEGEIQNTRPSLAGSRIFYKCSSFARAGYCIHADRSSRHQNRGLFEGYSYHTPKFAPPNLFIRIAYICFRMYTDAYEIIRLYTFAHDCKRIRTSAKTYRILTNGIRLVRKGLKTVANRCKRIYTYANECKRVLTGANGCRLVKRMPTGETDTDW